MKILILTQYPFPYGMAQTNRIISISKGLVYAGGDVKIVCLKPTEKFDNIKNNNARGEFEKIKFEYAGNNTIRFRNALLRLLYFIKSYFFSLVLVFREHKKKKVDIILMGYTYSFATILHFLLTRILKVIFIQERSEYPHLSYSKSFWGKLRGFIYLKIVCKLFDGFIVVTKALKQCFRSYVRKKIDITILPMLVEPERFESFESPENYIAYCGSMEGNKDGVPILIESFAIISKKIPDINLYLIGSTKFKGFEELQTRVEELNLLDRIKFTGRIERDNLPEYLKRAKVLALARPSSKQSEGGFPTKLGEYLSTGRPVVVTRVGELDDFLIHEKNAFISEPDSAEAFARQLENALSNYEKASKIGLEGKKLAFNEFNYKVQGKKLLEWLKTLKDD